MTDNRTTKPLRGVVMPYHNGEKQAKLISKQFDRLIHDELHDSREKLEEDILDYQGAWPLTDSTPIDVTWGIVRGWLDRQAAITRRECEVESSMLTEQCARLRSWAAQFDDRADLDALAPLLARDLREAADTIERLRDAELGSEAL